MTWLRYVPSLLLAAALAACTSPASPPMPTPPPDSTITFRVGRATIDMPAGVTVTPKTNGGTHDHVGIQEHLWPAGLALDGDARDAAREAVWAPRVDAARTMYTERPVEGSPLIEERALDIDGALWARALLRHDEYYTGMFYTWEVIADFGDVYLRVDERFYVDYQEYIEELIARIADVLGAYVRPDAEGYGTADWFYLRHGAIARSPTGLEGVRVDFAGHPVLDEIWFASTTVLRPSEEPGLVARWHEAQGIGLREMFGHLLSPSSKAEAHAVRVGSRSAGSDPDGAPLVGEEVLARYAIDLANEPAGDGLHFEWEHPGTPAVLSRPSLTLDAATHAGPPLSDAQIGAAVAAWDALLASIDVPSRPTRPRP